MCWIPRFLRSALISSDASESKTLATITFQNFFNKYARKCGATGTALTEENEFREIYGMDVVEVPTNRPIARKDLNDAVYKTKKEKLTAVIEEIISAHEKGQPVLVGTITIKVIDDKHLVILDHIVLIARHEIMCAQSQYNIVLNLQILRVGKVFDMEEFLHLRNALLGKVHILILLIDNRSGWGRFIASLGLVWAVS